MDEKLILIANPGSSSRKYALYRGHEFLAGLHFEFVNDASGTEEAGAAEKTEAAAKSAGVKRIICGLKYPDGTKKIINQEFKSLNSTVANVERILTEEGFLGGPMKLDYILVRIVAPGEYFTQDHLVDDECVRQLSLARTRSPLHVPAVDSEVAHFLKTFKSTPIIAISDSSFHADRPDLMKYYPINTEVADKADMKRFGFHGLSVGSVVRYMSEAGTLPEKLIVCHLGSGASVSAIFHGKSLDTSMGYTPLAGLMMATRCGDIDIVGAIRLKQHLGYTTDESLEKYLNKEAGLLGVSRKTDDMREILQLRDEGDKWATFAHAMYIYKIQSQIGKMAASLGGVDALVFTATIGERSAEIRHTVTQKLAYLGFELDREKNDDPATGHTNYTTFRAVNLATADSKPIWVVHTNEADEMIYRAEALLKAIAA